MRPIRWLARPVRYLLHAFDERTPLEKAEERALYALVNYWDGDRLDEDYNPGTGGVGGPKRLPGDRVLESRWAEATGYNVGGQGVDALVLGVSKEDKARSEFDPELWRSVDWRAVVGSLTAQELVNVLTVAELGAEGEEFVPGGDSSAEFYEPTAEGYRRAREWEKRKSVLERAVMTVVTLVLIPILVALAIELVVRLAFPQ